MASATLEDSVTRNRTVSFTEDTYEEIFQRETSNFRRSFTIPRRAQRPIPRGLELPHPSIESLNHNSRLDTLMRYIRAFANTLEYDLNDSTKWKEFVRSQLLEMVNGLRTLSQFDTPELR